MTTKTTRPQAFQPTLPARGATRTRVACEQVWRYFNPRSPHGERPSKTPARHTPESISTHAPRTGSDRRSLATWKQTRRFQPTLPARGATFHSVGHGGRLGYFNPRSPHGERQNHGDRKRREDVISTHAPRTGSDFMLHALCFNQQISTHAPRTGSDRLHVAGAQGISVAISTHAPRTGSDVTPILPCTRLSCISTHAPRTGSDQFLASLCGILGNFNPRSPHGERRRNRVFLYKTQLFQPTLPARGATRVCIRNHRELPISTHAPRTGSDVYGQVFYQHILISTHAPRTGSDAAFAKAPVNAPLFQPTLPARGAT